MGEIILRIPEDIKIEYDIKDSNDIGESVEKIKKYLKFKSAFFSRILQQIKVFR